ncbi:hypothetical protein [Roseivirga sp. E12]|nr:hypothetical protein [Roseivirga sp. E12]MBO3700832.1 hypothetical protein [Roseivirga sp. E12]
MKKIAAITHPLFLDVILNLPAVGEAKESLPILDVIPDLVRNPFIIGYKA